MSFSFNGEDLQLVVHDKPSHWKTHPITLQTTDGELYCKLSVNLPDAPDLPRPFDFWLKDWADNEDIVGFLVEEGWIELIIGEGVKMQRSGYVDIFAARLGE